MSFNRINLKTFLFCIILYFQGVCALNYNPYEILGVDKHASSYDIRKAYKHLAKEWHPDKNDRLDAESNFVKIKQAYELLIDNDRRRAYDQYGITNEDSTMYNHKKDYTQYERFSFDPMEELFGKHFHRDINLYQKLSITTKHYEKIIVAKSKFTPYIIIYYSDWSFRCTRMVGTFKRLIEIFEPLGIQFVTVNAEYEQQLFRKIGLRDVPSVTLVLNGHNYIYRDTLYTSQKVVEFIRKKLPRNLHNKVKDYNVDSFLNEWRDNKVRILLFEPRDQPRLRYLIAAYGFRNRAVFGFINTYDENCQNIVQRFQIGTKMDTLLLFNENTQGPVANITMLDMPVTTLKYVIQKNQYLVLPRLSSQDVFDGICPAEWSRPNKHLCVILITEDVKEHDYPRRVLRDIALRSSFPHSHVRFAYIFKKQQIDFINAITRGSPNNKLLHLVAVWRRSTVQLKYEWLIDASLEYLSSTLNESTNYLINETNEKIRSTIQRLLKPSEALAYEAVVQDLNDEYAESLINKWASKASDIYDYMVDTIEEEHLLATLSFIGTLLFMFAIGYAMLYYVKIEEETLKAAGQLSTKSNNSTNNRYVPELRLHELRAEKYNGMVRLLKPGCRTIILITDVKSRPKLLPPYHKALWPFRKSKTLIFGTMLIEKGISWYAELLRLSLGETKTLHINPRNCVGTVLALNGHRKYFCIYHSKHPEVPRGVKRMADITEHLTQYPDDLESGQYFKNQYSNIEVQKSEDYQSKILLEEHLLDGLSNWLDRLFEGTTHRYYINYWPEFSIK